MSINSSELIIAFKNFTAKQDIKEDIGIGMVKDLLTSVLETVYGKGIVLHIEVNMGEGSENIKVWHIQKVVEDRLYDNNSINEISLTSARLERDDYGVGESFFKKILFDKIPKNAIKVGLDCLLGKIRELEKTKMYDCYKRLQGQILYAEVQKVLPTKIWLLDDERNKLVLPKRFQIRNEVLKEGQYIPLLVESLNWESRYFYAVGSRVSPVLLQRLFEQDIPEVQRGEVIIKKVVRDPGERAKVLVTTDYEDINPVGSCVGTWGGRIRPISKNLNGEQIDIIAYSSDFTTLVGRILGCSDIIKVVEKADILFIYLEEEDVSKAIGKHGKNIQLSSRLLDKKIIIYSKEEEKNEDGGVELLSPIIGNEAVSLLRRQDKIKLKDIKDWREEDFLKLGIDSAEALLCITYMDEGKN